ncbi:nucleoside hydrolase [Anaerococcus porci]|uniref:Nucleoside hydrolase n=1 Tax=Anaerococcus porci TaxID=2652269 RepID=A0A6N7VDT8_9FIRM|nr:nucleoside hydrolase [Anaerococcus porci]MDY3006134.1 nucleoside hydrolase [Anaerococcus porci]MSS77620.1 nucleoside hydrolase [Anaerococcus porci]
MQREKPFVYIDTNFSLSEMLMIKLAFNSSEFELVGLSTITSFMDSKTAANNILSMAGEEGLIFPIASGENKNLKGQDILSLGENKTYFNKPLDYLQEDEGYKALYQIAQDCGRLDIITTGPLTNIAKAIIKYPDFVSYIDHIFIFGSSFGMGDITLNSEFNFFTDPKAVNIVLNEDIETFILPIDLSNSLGLSDDILKIDTHDEILSKIFNLYKKLDKDQRDISRALLLYMAMTPQAFIFEEKSIKVSEDIDRGRILEIDGKKKKYIANRVNEKSFYDFLRDKLGDI